MIKLNLLPSSERKRFKILKIEKCILFSALSLFVYFILALGVLLFFQYQMQANLAFLKSQIKQEEQKLSSDGGLQTKVKKINSELKTFDTLQKKKGFISPFLVDIFSLTPPEINYKKISFEKTANKIVLWGIAEERDKLLEFQDNLKKIEGVKRIESPLSNLEKDKQAEFLIKLFLSSP